MKRCSKCKQEYPATAEHFAADRRNRDGLGPRCRCCDRERGRAWKASNRERHRERGRAWAAANRERTREKSRERGRRIRAEVVELLGWSCARCGSTERLEIDHVLADGGERRTEAGNWHRERLRILTELLAGRDAGVQLLCLDCHRAKTNEERRAQKAKASVG